MDKSISCTIGLGSNTTDREYQITKAIEHICAYLQKCSISSVYESEACNGKRQTVSQRCDSWLDHT